MYILPFPPAFCVACLRHTLCVAYTHAPRYLHTYSQILTQILPDTYTHTPRYLHTYSQILTHILPDTTMLPADRPTHSVLCTHTHTHTYIHTYSDFGEIRRRHSILWYTHSLTLTFLKFKKKIALRCDSPARR